jgi:hypothetical protein
MHGLKDGDTGVCGHFELLVCVGVAFPALSVTAPGLNLGAYLPGGASLRDSRIGSASDAFFCNKGSFPTVHSTPSEFLGISTGTSSLSTDPNLTACRASCDTSTDLPPAVVNTLDKSPAFLVSLLGQLSTIHLSPASTYVVCCVVTHSIPVDPDCTGFGTASLKLAFTCCKLSSLTPTTLTLAVCKDTGKSVLKPRSALTYCKLSSLILTAFPLAV